MNLKFLGALALLMLLSCSPRRYGHLTVRTTAGERSVGLVHTPKTVEPHAAQALEAQQPDGQALSVQWELPKRHEKFPLLKIARGEHVVFRYAMPLNTKVLEKPIESLREHKQQGGGYADFMGVTFGIIILALIVWLVVRAIAPNLGWGCLTWALIIILAIVIGLLFGLAFVELTK